MGSGSVFGIDVTSMPKTDPERLLCITLASMDTSKLFNYSLLKNEIDVIIIGECVGVCIIDA